jgi:two-component system, cell cycle sensor histidine kinase and response regulator CckA
VRHTQEPSTNAIENFEPCHPAALPPHIIGQQAGPVHAMMSARVAVPPVTPDLNPSETERRRSLRLEALGQLTGAVAHDFNNLLTIIVGNLERLRDGSRDAFVQHGAKAALDAAMRGEKLVRSLLAFARRRPLSHRAFDLNDAIREMVPLLRQSLGASIKLTPVLASDALPVETDMSQTEMAVLNLVVNARDAMPDGGRLRIETATVRLTGEYDGLRGMFAALTVTDTGCGMSPEVLAHAFEPFFTTKAEGTGLGLSMVYGFARQSLGTAVIGSARTTGTAVTIYLPRSLAGLGTDATASTRR